MKKSRHPKAFTIMEIMIVVIIMGIIAAFAIPNFSRSIAQTHLQDAMMQLSAIRSANQVYYARTSTFWPNTGGNKDVTAINSSLSLNLIENGMTYTCVCTNACDGTEFQCTAVPTDAAFTVTVTQGVLSLMNPSCAGACP